MRRTFDRAQADGFTGSHFAAHPAQRGHVAAREINHMDVVAHAGSVRGVVVVAEHPNAFQLSHGYLRHIGKQVVGDALGVLADKPAFVGADGVEVAQEHDVPLVIAHVKIGEDLLEHRFRLPVGIRGAVFGARFGDGDELGFAVHGCAAGKHDVLHAVRARYVAEHKRSRDVVPVVLEGLLDAFAHGLEPREVDDRIDVVFGEDAL